MSGEIEALGGLVTAGLAADALDRPGPRHGAGDDINAAEIADAHHVCANCDAPLNGNFCANCGQQAHVHRSLLHVGEEFLHGITHFDGKAWQTLPMLMFRPGKLTRNYIEGKRARYIAPVPLFLLVVFTMFFVLSFVKLPTDAVEIGGDATPAERSAQIDVELSKIDADIAAATAAGKNDEVARLKRMRAGIVAVANVAGKPGATAGDLVDSVGAQILAANQRGESPISFGDSVLDAKAQAALKNPKLFLYKLQSKAYKLSFLLVPLSLPWLWLAFFWRRGIGMYDHAIFALYSISFISLVFVTGSLAVTAGITNGTFWGLLLLAPAVHMFAQLRGAYAIGWWGAAWRTLYLSVAAMFSLSVYLVILILLGVLD
jgi:hypothetical protein